MPVYRLTGRIAFPPLEHAEEGILAVGGGLEMERLLLAYASGIFPWYSDTEPIIWWSPDPRCVLFPENLRVTRSMRQILRAGKFRISLDTAFPEVIRACAFQPRHGQPGTWITEDMMDAYIDLHREGYAHSAEVWEDDRLVGGLYGVSLGSAFFGESMFHRSSNASKYAFMMLVQTLQDRGFGLIDCQVENDHLLSLGAENIPRKRYQELLKEALQANTVLGPWTEWWERGLLPEF